jgi:SAM-dependent methyltransferase
VLLLNQVIEHLVDTDGLVREVRRVLVPGGVLLLSTPNLAAWFNRILLFGGVQPVFSEVSSVGVFGRPGRQVVGHLRLFTRRALAEFLTAHGFVDLAFAGGTYHDVPRGMKWLDRLAVHRPGLAANLLVRAISPTSQDARDDGVEQ